MPQTVSQSYPPYDCAGSTPAGGTPYAREKSREQLSHLQTEVFHHMAKRFIDLQFFADGGGDGSADRQGSKAGSGNGGQSNARVTYSYEQAEEIANSGAERAKRSALSSFFKQQGMSEEQITAAIEDYKSKRESSKPDVTKLTAERDAAQKELADYKNAETLRKKGVKDEYMSYVTFEIGKMTADGKKSFEKAADEFLKDHPAYSGKGSYRVSTGTQSGGAGSAQDDHEAINNSIRKMFGH
jgi:hypothetical protein